MIQKGGILLVIIMLLLSCIVFGFCDDDFEDIDDFSVCLQDLAFVKNNEKELRGYYDTNGWDKIPDKYVFDGICGSDYLKCKDADWKSMSMDILKQIDPKSMYSEAFKNAFTSQLRTGRNWELIENWVQNGFEFDMTRLGHVLMKEVMNEKGYKTENLETTGGITIE
jgi:hypothetical protein